MRDLDCQRVAQDLALRGRGRRFYCPSCQPDGGKDPDLSTPGDYFRCHKCGASGGPLDLVALTRGLNLRDGGHLREAVTLLAPLAGVSVDEPIDEERVRAQRELQASRAARAEAEAAEKDAARVRLAEALVGVANPAAALPWLQARGFPPNVADLAESGFGVIAPEDARRIEAPRWVRGLTPALVVPTRPIGSNAIEGAHVRALGGDRKTLGRLTSPNGAPRVFGWAGAALRAELLVVCEGATDTLAAEAAFRRAPSVVVIGANGAGQLERIAEYIAGRPGPSRVTILRDFDSLAGDGAGQVAARNAERILGRRAIRFDWNRFLNTLEANAGPLVDAGSFDLSDVLSLAGLADFATTLRAVVLGDSHAA